MPFSSYSVKRPIYQASAPPVSWARPVWLPSANAKASNRVSLNWAKASVGTTMICGMPAVKTRSAESGSCQKLYSADGVWLPNPRLPPSTTYW